MSKSGDLFLVTNYLAYNRKQSDIKSRHELLELLVVYRLVPQMLSLGTGHSAYGRVVKIIIN